MQNRINMRKENLAIVNEDKQDEDYHLFSGMLAVGSYFEPRDRKDTKIFINNQGKWAQKVYNKDTKSEVEVALANNKYMYAVGENGALYMDNVTVHSQFKAGKHVQSAGHLVYKSDPLSVLIDNNSGHYHPTLSQFLSTIYGLIRAEILPTELQILLNNVTKNDYSNSVDPDFWKSVISSEQPVNVVYDQASDGLKFTTESGTTCFLHKDALLEKGQFPNLESNVVAPRMKQL